MNKKILIKIFITWLLFLLLTIIYNYISIIVTLLFHLKKKEGKMVLNDNEARNELLEVIDLFKENASDFLQSVLDKFHTSISKITELSSDTLKEIVNECDSQGIAW